MPRRAAGGAAAQTLSPARGEAPKNLALDPLIVERVKNELVPLVRRTRQERNGVLRERWLRYYRIWSVRHDRQGYVGRSNTYFPVGRRWIEQWVTRLKRDLFPDQDWFACRALREDFEARVPAKQALAAYWMRRHMRLRKHALPWLRQLVMYGTSPVRNVWRAVEHEQTVLRDVLDDDGQPSGKTIEQVEKVADFLGPTFEPVDLFAFYVWPPTAACRGAGSMPWPRSRSTPPTRKAAMSTRGWTSWSRSTTRRCKTARAAKRVATPRSLTRSPFAWPIRGLLPRSTSTCPRRSARSISPNACGRSTWRTTSRRGTWSRLAPTRSPCACSVGPSGTAARNGSSAAFSRFPRNSTAVACASCLTISNTSSTTSATSRVTRLSGRRTRLPLLTLVPFRTRPVCAWRRGPSGLPIPPACSSRPRRKGPRRPALPPSKATSGWPTPWSRRPPHGRWRPISRPARRIPRAWRRSSPIAPSTSGP